MGSSQSSPTTSEITDVSASSKNGPKTKPTILISPTTNTVEEDKENSSVVSTTESDDDDYSSDEEENEVDDFFAERKLILADAKNLKKLAVDYLHPEKPVVVTDPSMFGRNYFGRASAPTEYDDDDNFLTTLSRVREGNVVQDKEDERNAIMEDLKQLKTAAEWFLHPERPVVETEPSLFGRNYFGRASAPTEYDDDDNFLTTLSRVHEGCVVQDMEDERNAIMEDLKQLKMTADWFLHPEKPVVVSDTTACGRNYFTRPSAPQYDDADNFLTTLSRVREGHVVQDMEDERNAIMEDLEQLKMTADWFLHPEKPVVVSDATACGRNYFTRPSAPQYDDADNFLTTLSRAREGHVVQDMEDERNAIMEDLKQLKMTADWFLHPEKPVAFDATSCGRNYFTRPSAPQYDNDDDDNFLTTLSRVREGHVVQDMEEERNAIMEDLKQLKMTAEWFLHPEKPIVSDATSCGRNYFTRPSAPQYDDDDEEEERVCVLGEMKQLKTTAEWFLHPEKPIVTDGTACGRNYFTRSSAPVFDDADEEERERIMEDMKELKTTADWYLHPEKKVVVGDSTVCGRNYFTRASAPEYDDDADDIDEERELVLAEATELKKVADWYLHPEKKIVVDSTACGRNYFTRPSAPEDDGTDVEREGVLAEAAELKKMANWCHNPNQPVISDGFATARNFFTRPSAPEEEDDDLDEAREGILSEAAELKKMADWCHNPNQPVVSDGFATGRNYFTRPSAPEYEDDGFGEERNRVLAEAKELKEVAEWYHDPTKPIKSNIAVTRNYFTRLSAPVEDTEDEEERAKVLADALELRKLAIDYLHPEKPVASSSINCVRNYFDRPSAKGNHADYIHTEGHANHPDDHMEEHYVMHDDDYLYDHHHHDDISHGSFQSHGDHFDMDEDVYHGFRESINAFRDSVTSVHDQQIPIIKEEGDGKEGNLSRSPSSIMLFEEPAI